MKISKALVVASLAAFTIAAGPQPVVFPDYAWEGEARSAAIKTRNKLAVEEFSVPSGNDGFTIGTALIGFPSEPRPVRYAKSVGGVLARAIESAAGVHGLDVRPAASADLLLRGAIREIGVEEVVFAQGAGYSRAVVRFDAVLQDDEGRIRWARTISARRLSKLAADPSSMNEATIRAAFDDAIDQLLEDASFRSAVAAR